MTEIKVEKVSIDTLKKMIIFKTGPIHIFFLQIILIFIFTYFLMSYTPWQSHINPSRLVPI